MTTETTPSPGQPGTIRFGLPIVLLLLLLATITGGLLVVAVGGQDRVARDASKTIARAAFDTKRKSLQEIVRDYSWWNAAVENLIFDFNAEWARDNLEWLPENFGISDVLVFGPEGDPVYSTLDSGRPGSVYEDGDNPGLREVVARTRSQPDVPEATTTAFVEFPDGVRLVSASKLLEEEDTTGHPPYPHKGVLVVTLNIDQPLINEIANSFQLHGLELVRERNSGDNEAALPLTDATGHPIAYMAWNPPQPGSRMFEWLAAPLGIAFALVGGVIAMIIVRARRAGIALQEAFEARVAAQKRLEHSARHDSLTGLPNRALFLEHLQTAIAHSLRYGSSFTLHYLDLDGFKAVNDTYGHPAGDRLLEELADRFRSEVRAADTVARFGGDEFAILQRGTSDAGDARLLAGRLIEAVEKPFHIAEPPARVTLSVGIAFDTESEDPEEIIRKADRALYRAKRRGGNRHEIYDPTQDEQGLQQSIASPVSARDPSEEPALPGSN